MRDFDAAQKCHIVPLNFGMWCWLNDGGLLHSSYLILTCGGIMPCLLAIAVKLMLKPVEAKVYYSTHLSLNKKRLSREAVSSVPSFGARLQYIDP
jgi:hypothetical protein